MKDKQRKAMFAKQSIQLQGVGSFQAKPAKDIVVGEDYFVWNYGSTSKPIKVLKESPKQIVFQTKTEDGKLWERRMNKDRLVAYANDQKY